MTTRNPQPAYQAVPGTQLEVNRAFYTSLTTPNNRRLLRTITIAPRTGEAWPVPAGCIFRISTPDGPQVGDLNIWNLHNPREQMWTARSRQLHASHLRTFDRLWSKLPYMRPMVTVIDNTLENYGVDRVGGRVHDLLGTRCDPYINKMMTRASFDFHCHSNLTRAILPFGLGEADVHDNVNLFQVTGLNRDDQYFIEPSPAKAGDFIEFFAEIDVLCALSACPAGDESVFGWGEESTKNMAATCRPLLVEVYELIEKEKLLFGWKSPDVQQYNGMHGIGLLPTANNGLSSAS